jgi:large conductance mechanosensitive channel
MTTTPSPTPPTPVGLFQEFRAFLDKYGVVGLAIAFIIGAALTSLVQALVKGLLMPLLNPIFDALGSDWRTYEGFVGPVGPFLWGELLYALIYFLIIAAFVFVIAKYFLREQSVAKK